MSKLQTIGASCCLYTLMMLSALCVDAQFQSYPSSNLSDKEFTSSSLLFTENKGQVVDEAGKICPEVLFTAQSKGVNIYLSATGLIYKFERHVYPKGFERDERKVKDRIRQELLSKQIKVETHQFALSLAGANLSPVIYKEEKNVYTENFFLPHCPDGITDVHTYGRVIMKNVYSGIDRILYSNETGFKYDFIVQPGADPSQIIFEVRGAEKASISKQGELVLKTSLGFVKEAPPKAFCDGKIIKTSFNKDANGKIKFALGAWDRSKTLVIDPSVSWSTYYGVGGIDEAYACAVDQQDNVFLAGVSNSRVGLGDGGFKDDINGANRDAILVKVSSTGVRLWGTYFGGYEDENAMSCAVDKTTGDVYISGYTASSDFLTTAGAHQPAIGGPARLDGFLTKFSTSGSLLWSTYYGGDETDYARACTVDGTGNVYIAGHTNSSSGIAVGGHQNTFGGAPYEDAFLVKFNSAGTRQWGTYLGGTGSDDAKGCAVDLNNNIYIAGSAGSNSAIATLPYLNSTGDAFLAKFNSSGIRLWGRYFGGGGDNGHSCIVDNRDNNGDVYLAGITTGTTDLATLGSHQPTKGPGVGVYDAYLAKFNANGALQWATYYGGDGNEDGYAATGIDAAGNVFLAGMTSSPNNIASSFDALKSTGSGGYDAFIAKFNSNGVRQWGTYYGGESDDRAMGFAADSKLGLYLAGTTQSSSDIATAGSYQPIFGGILDGFLLKINNTQNDNAWTGAVNNDWNNNANWSCGVIPPAGADLTVPASANPPSLTSDIVVGSLTLHGILNINGHTLTINGAVTGAGTFTGSATSNMIINGNAGVLNFTPGAAILFSLQGNQGGAGTVPPGTLTIVGP